MGRGGRAKGSQPPPNDDARRRRRGSRDLVAPHNIEAEESLLGAALLSADAAEIVAVEIDAGAFYKPAHGHIATAIARLFEADRPIDPVTVEDELRREGLSDDVGGLPALLSLEANTPASSNAGRYAEIVTDHATLRALQAGAGEIAEIVSELPSDVGAAVLRAQEIIGRNLNGNVRHLSSLEVADVGAILDGSFELVEPDFLTRTDGQALIYAGKVNLLFAPHVSGKSWLALAICLEVLAMGGCALYIDYEDSPRGIVGRLLSLGADPAQVRERFRYVRLEGGFGPAEKVAVEKLYVELNPDLIVIDGWLEALSRDEYLEDSAVDIAAWSNKFSRWLARKGSAVLILDHVTKDKEKRSSARGSGHKLAVIDGAAFEVIVTTPFSRHKEGKLRLRLEKDRNGAYGAQGDTVAVVTVTPVAGGARVVLKIDPDTARDSKADPWKPTRLMAAISVELERALNPLTPAAIVNMLSHAKPGLVREAIARLMAEGFVVEARHGRSKVLKLVRPYHKDVDPSAPSEEQLAQQDLELGIDPDRPPGDPGF